MPSGKPLKVINELLFDEYNKLDESILKDLEDNEELNVAAMKETDNTVNLEGVVSDCASYNESGDKK